MTSEERKPMFETYRKIVKEIIDNKIYREYALSEIDSLNNSLMENFRQISNTMLLHKNWFESISK